MSRHRRVLLRVLARPSWIISRALTIPKPSPDATETRRALLLMLGSAMLFGAMAFTAKLASARLTGSQVAMIRFAIGCLPALLIPRFRARALTFQRLDLLFYRGFFGGAGRALLLHRHREDLASAWPRCSTTPRRSSAVLFSMLFLHEQHQRRRC